MPSARTCSKCGAELPDDAPPGLCGKCSLFGRIFEPAGATATEHGGEPATGPRQSREHITNYKLLEKIGEGGFGEVWMAEQEHPVRRRVALKIIKWGMDTREVVARFEAE